MIKRRLNRSFGFEPVTKLKFGCSNVWRVDKGKGIENIDEWREKQKQKGHWRDGGKKKQIERERERERERG